MKTTYEFREGNFFYFASPPVTGDLSIPYQSGQFGARSFGVHVRTIFGNESNEQKTCPRVKLVVKYPSPDIPCNVTFDVPRP